MKTFLTLSFHLLITSFLLAQSPQGIPYQAVMRNADGSVMASSAVSLIFMIHDVSATGTVVYQESHALTSNAQGLVSCVVGNGVVSQGNLADINWGNGAKFMHVMMGTTDLGTQQMLSVPYTFYTNEVPLRVSPIGDSLIIGNDVTIVPGISAANFPSVLGCTDNAACNYNIAATQSDNSCLYQNAICDDGNATTIGDVINSSCVCVGSPIVNGCTNPLACNYNAAANVDNGSCLVQGNSCNDNNASTINDIINASCQCLGTLSNTGATLLPGNATCSAQVISVTGCGGQTSLTYDGLTYDLVQIGGQCWFADNLATDQYRNGDLIASGLTNTNWSNTSSGAYHIYANSPSNDATYGKLYNWFSVTDTRGLCPTGWHVPTDCEWMYLENALGINVNDQVLFDTWVRGTDQGGRLKSTTLWDAPNLGANNNIGFSALPGAYRGTNGTGGFLNSLGYWWTSTATTSTNAWYRVLGANYATVNRISGGKRAGFSIRCVKD
jgi:uncharacterized protein (TIGR02145 family)